MARASVKASVILPDIAGIRRFRGVVFAENGPLMQVSPFHATLEKPLKHLV